MWEEKIDSRGPWVSSGLKFNLNPNFLVTLIFSLAVTNLSLLSLSLITDYTLPYYFFEKDDQILDSINHISFVRRIA